MMVTQDHCCPNVFKLPFATCCNTVS
jgi:hypothetical protein